jgi:hypothetical protein
LRFSLVKTAVDESGDRLLAREARWLRELEAVSELDGQVPRLLDEGTDRAGRRYLVMSIAHDSSGETRAFTPDHARFLSSLGKARFRSTDFELSGTGEWLHGSLRRLNAIASREEMAFLQEAFHDCETALLYWTGPYVAVQGDFAPWNIRTSGDQIFVSEWGRARAEASPLEDVLHYLMIQPALRQRRVSAAFIRGAMARAREFALQAYPEWSWRPQIIGALTLVYLLGTVVQHSLARERVELDDAVVGSYWRLLETRAAWMPD